MPAPKMKSKYIDSVAVYEIIRRLSTSFKDTEAYKVGLIDDKGVIQKSRASMTLEEKKMVSLFDVMIFNIKRLLQKLPGGDSKLRNFATALFLLRESISMDYIDQYDVEFLAEEFESQDKKRYSDLMEEIATSIGGGSMDQDPVVRKKAKQSKFGKCVVFQIESDDYMKVTREKRPSERFKKYIKDDCSLESVREYAKKNPSKSIMVSDKRTGAMTFVKLGSKQKW